MANKSTQTVHQLHQSNQRAKREANDYKYKCLLLEQKYFRLKNFAEAKLLNQEAILPEDLIELLEG
ncbi:hypothetical protein LG275_03875 [Chryseomicrobium palamuruense]